MTDVPSRPDSAEALHVRGGKDEVVLPSPDPRLPGESCIRDSRILIVDDRISDIMLLENVLRRLGYREVRGTTDPQETFEAIQTWRPDLVVLDLATPQLNGFKVLELLHKNVPRSEWVPVLILTGDRDPGARRKALASGASEFIPKPFDSTEILIRIRNLLLMHTLRKELRDQNRLLEEKVAERTKKLSDRSAELEATLVELKRTQQQVLQQERFRALSEMAGGVAHDFNNILNCVVGYTDLLLSNPALLKDEKGTEECLRAMHTAAQDGALIVSRLRNLYRAKTGKDVFTRVDVAGFLREVAAITQPRWKTQALGRGQAVRMEVDAPERLAMACNQSELREALTNLIFNAVDAMPAGGTITLTGRQEDTFVLLGVSDTGAGMTEEVRDRCMEPFFSTKGDNGTGLGLAVVFGIAQRHGGTVEIESKLGRGTTVWIRIAVQTTTAVVAPEQPVPEMPALHILAVDDDPVCRDLLTKLLSAEGHTMVSAANALDALAIMDLERFDLIILDHAMPRMTGAELANLVRRKDQPPPVIMITGASQIPNVEETIPVVVRKPFTKDVLRRAIAQVVKVG